MALEIYKSLQLVEFRVSSEMSIWLLKFLSLNLYFFHIFTHILNLGSDWGLEKLEKSCSWVSQTLVSVQAERWMDWEEPCWGLGDTGGRNELSMCFCNPKSQSNPGLQRRKHGQQIKGGDSGPLLCSVETQPGVLHPAVGSPAQEGQGPLGKSPEDVTGMIRGSISPMRKGERTGIAQPGEEKAAGWPNCGFPVPPVEGSL